MHYIISGDELWIPSPCIANTPNPSVHNNILLTEWQTEPDQAAAPTTTLQNQKAAVATLIKIPAASPRAAAATMIINTLAPVAVGLTLMKIAENGTNPGVILTVKRAWNTSR
jgi:hypothetical protein